MRKLAAMIAGVCLAIGLTPAPATAFVYDAFTYRACDNVGGIQSESWVCIYASARRQDDGVGMVLHSVRIRALECDGGGGFDQSCAPGHWTVCGPGGGRGFDADAVDTLTLDFENGPGVVLWDKDGTPDLEYSTNGCDKTWDQLGVFGNGKHMLLYWLFTAHRDQLGDVTNRIGFGWDNTVTIGWDWHCINDTDSCSRA